VFVFRLGLGGWFSLCLQFCTRFCTPLSTTLLSDVRILDCAFADVVFLG